MRGALGRMTGRVESKAVGCANSALRMLLAVQGAAGAPVASQAKIHTSVSRAPTLTMRSTPCTLRLLPALKNGTA